MKRTISRGFTLIELMIAVAIIAVLVAVGAAVYAELQKKSRDSRRMQDVRAVQNAAEAYYSDETRYPSKSEIITRLESKVFPVDPKSGHEAYEYTTSGGALGLTSGSCGVGTGTNTCYTMCAKLELPANKANALGNTGTVGTGDYFCGRARQ